MEVVLICYLVCIREELVFDMSIGFFIGVVIISICEFYVVSTFYSTKINFKSIRFYVALALVVFFSMLNYSYVNAFVKMIIATFLLGLGNWLIFRQKMNKTIISTLFTHLLISISDTVGVLVVLLFVGNVDFIKSNVFGSLIGNVIVALILLLINRFKFIKKLYLKLVDFTDNLKINRFLNLCILIIISINFLLAVMYYELKSVYVIVINLVLLLIYSFIVYKTMNEKNNNIIMEAKNASLMDSLHQYEEMVDRQRINNHENKNQLLIIKNMIKKKDKDIIKYIDSVVKDKKEDDEALYTRVKNIPSGGLQGIVYQKMLVMKDEKILFSLDVSRDVRKVSLDNLSMDDNYRLCKIVGVLLDNAIEESRNVLDKRIMISLYVDEDRLIIDISNRFNGDIQIDKLDDEGYTTKGDGHGYGLSLVKKILSETDMFENERSIKNDVFKQVIKVKIKNT